MIMEDRRDLVKNGPFENMKIGLFPDGWNSIRLEKRDHGYRRVYNLGSLTVQPCLKGAVLDTRMVTAMYERSILMSERINVWVGSNEELWDTTYSDERNIPKKANDMAVCSIIESSWIK